MGKIEEMDGDVESPRDDSSEPEVVEDISDEDSEEVEGGIFDEDLEDVAEDDSVSDFDIGTTLLTAAAPVESWAGQNLEETISRERVEKDWGDAGEFVGSDVYKPAEGGADVYGASSGDVYSASRGSGVYDGSGGSGPYSAEKGGEGSYDAPGGGKGGIKSYDQLKDERRGAKSMLEIAGFEDKGKKEHRDFTRDFVAYDAGKAA